MSKIKSIIFRITRIDALILLLVVASLLAVAIPRVLSVNARHTAPPSRSIVEAGSGAQNP